MRIFTEEEQTRLDLDSRGLLVFLEQNEILTQRARELVIERALALDTPYISEEELKWIVLLVLMNQPGQETAFARMEDMVYNDDPLFLH
jgi:Smg protein